MAKKNSKNNWSFEEREAKDMQKKLTSHKKLAQERTLLANKRTFLAYIRTGLAFFALGAGLVGLLEEHIVFVYGGYFSSFFGVLFIVLSFIRFYKKKKKILSY